MHKICSSVHNAQVPIWEPLTFIRSLFLFYVALSGSLTLASTQTTRPSTRFLADPSHADPISPWLWREVRGEMSTFYCWSLFSRFVSSILHFNKTLARAPYEREMAYYIICLFWGPVWHPTSRISRNAHFIMCNSALYRTGGFCCFPLLSFKFFLCVFQYISSK